MSGEPAEISELTQAENRTAASEGESELQHWWFQ